MLARITKVTRSGDSGASAVEYGLLVAAIAAVIIVVVVALGDQLSNIFTNVETQLPDGNAPADGGGGGG